MDVGKLAAIAMGELRYMRKIFPCGSREEKGQKGIEKGIAREEKRELRARQKTEEGEEGEEEREGEEVKRRRRRTRRCWSLVCTGLQKGKDKKRHCVSAKAQFCI
jgi:hypothetical protein